jgi:hypothetical protein
MSINGALLALTAASPQDSFVWGKDFTWAPHIHKHTPFAIQQRTIPVVNLHTSYLGNFFQIDLKPRDLPDILSNMYLQFTLPLLDSLGNSIAYTPQVGRAVISKANFLIDGQQIESLKDDWYIIRDELFLDADQKLSMFQAAGTSNALCTGGEYIVPLEFFFCHRKGDHKPYLPTCALNESVISVQLYFNSSAWITNSPTIDISKVNLLVEGQLLENEEKLHYMTTPQTYNIPIAYLNPNVTYKNGVATIHLSAGFPVSMLVWFIRNLKYESGNSRYFASRYNYGYTTKYIQNSVPVTYFDGTTNNYIDPLYSVTMWFNNTPILSSFPDGIYHSIVQPMQHNLSIPTNDLYTYCFTNSPKNYQLDGAVDFSKYDYKTTRIDISFLPQYASQIQNGFSLNLYFAGFITLTVANGKATFSTV